MRKVCRIVNHYCKLPKANRRRWKKGLVHVCLDCHEPYYIRRVEEYSMDGGYTVFTWEPLNEEEDNE